VKCLTITIEYLTDADRRAALRKILVSGYRLPQVPGDGPPCKFSDKELNGSERVRYKIISNLREER
jgi:hypothetical protein